ncbi:MAG: TIGR01906 family membrane protein [Clostridia bacterium]|nr:TIGR01906 family membrane protein [Clostridia bacterium]
MLKNRFFTILFCVLLCLFTITLSIALPVCIRPFYYAHIDAYNLEEVTGKTESEIKEAYNAVLDYLTKPRKEFKTGNFKYSQEGKSHFRDCKSLFSLNFAVLFISLLGIFVLSRLKRKGIIKFTRPFGKHISLISGGLTIFLFVSLGFLVSLNFEKAFVVFHKIFFGGKENWVFNPLKDEIIQALPQEFFLNCAILIFVSIIFISLILIFFGLFSKKDDK